MKKRLAVLIGSFFLAVGLHAAGANFGNGSANIISLTAPLTISTGGLVGLNLYSGNAGIYQSMCGGLDGTIPHWCLATQVSDGQFLPNSLAGGTMFRTEAATQTLTLGNAGAANALTLVNGTMGFGVTNPSAFVEFGTFVQFDSSVSFAGGNSVIESTQPAIPFVVNSSTPLTLNTSSVTVVGTPSGNTSPVFQVNTASFTVTRQGYVGIGTTNPSQMLTVGAGVSQRNMVLVASTGTTSVNMALFGDSSSLGYGGVGTTNNFPFVVVGNNNINAVVTATGTWNFGATTAAPAFAEINIATGTLGLAPYTTTQTDLMTPSKAGLVLLNTTLNLVCFSSGTTLASYVRMNAPTTACR